MTRFADVHPSVLPLVLSEVYREALSLKLAGQLAEGGDDWGAAHFLAKADESRAAATELVTMRVVA